MFDDCGARWNVLSDRQTFFTCLTFAAWRTVTTDPRLARTNDNTSDAVHMENNNLRNVTLNSAFLSNQGSLAENVIPDILAVAEF